MRLLQEPAAVALVAGGLRADLHGGQIVEGRQRRVLVAQGRQGHGALVEVARPDGLVAGRGLGGVDRVAPRVRQRGDQRAGVGAVLLDLQHQGRGLQQLAAILRRLAQARQLGQRGQVVFPTHARALAAEAGQHLGIAGLQRGGGGRIGDLGVGAEADREVEGGFLGHGRQLAGQDDRALGRGGGRLQAEQRVVVLEHAGRGLGERLGPLQAQEGLALVGGERGRRRCPRIAAAGVGHVRLQHQGRGHRAFQRLDRHAHEQAVAVGVGEDPLLDDEAALLVRRRDLVGRRQRTAGAVDVQVFGLGGRVRALDRQAGSGLDGDPHLLDLGLVDQAVHGLGQHAVGDREPDLGHRPGLAAGLVGAVDIGLVGRADAGLGRIGPGAGRGGVGGAGG